MNPIDETKNPWQQKTDSIVYENNWIRVHHQEVTTPGGTDGIYGLVHFKNLAIGIIALDENNHTWVVGQYRYPLKKYSWEIPEGGGTIGINPLLSAQRELLEECGIEAGSWEKILEMDLSNSATDEHAIVFVARNLSFVNAAPEETEELQVKKIPFEDLFQEVMKGNYQDAITVAGVLKLKLLLMEQI